jgi:hypothetical protein
MSPRESVKVNDGQRDVTLFEFFLCLARRVLRKATNLSFTVTQHITVGYQSL